MATTLTATPTKLRNGSWGARVTTSRVNPGDTITITTKAGKTWTARVGRVLWTGSGAAIVTTDTNRTARPTTRNESWCPLHDEGFGRCTQNC